MGIKIEISSSNIQGDTRILNGATILGDNNVNIGLNKTHIGGKTQILNDSEMPKGSSVNVEINESELGENATILNDTKLPKGRTDFKLNGKKSDIDPEFMNGEKFNKSENNQQTSTKATTFYQRTDKRPDKKQEGLLKRLVSLILGKEEKEVNYEVHYSTKSHKDFEYEVSNGGKLKDLDTSEAIKVAQQSAEKNREQETR